MRFTAVLAGAFLLLSASIGGVGHAASPPPAALELERSLGPRGVVDLDPDTGTPRVVTRLDAPLTRPSSDRPDEVVRSYLRDHRDAFRLDESEIANLEVVRRFRARETLTHLTYALTYRGIPVAGAGLRAAVTDDGRLVTLSGQIVPDVRVDSTAPAVTASAAVRIARADAGASADPPPADLRPRFPGGGAAKLVIVPGRGDRDALAWRVLTRAPGGETFDTTVDAATGTVVDRRPLSSGVRARVFDHYPGAPRGGDQRVVDLAPYKFTDEERARYGLFGPNAFVFADVNDDEGYVGRELIPPSNDSGDYEHLYSPFTGVPGGNCPETRYACSWDHTKPFSWSVNVDQAATQLFWYVNRFHDHLLAPPIEFTPAKGNFEEAGDDEMWGTVAVGAAIADGLPEDPGEELGDVNNAYFSYAPDGSIPLIVTLLFKPTFLDPTQAVVNSADDAAIVYHEYGHGLSSRLVTDAQGVHGLTEPQPRAIGEGISDWYAVDYLVAQGLMPDSAAPGEVGIGQYLGNSRAQPMDCPVGAPAAQCPQDPEGTSGPGGFTFGDVGRVINRPEPHADGEMLAQTLWDLRRRLIGERGAASGVARTRLLVTAALELSPVEPTFLDFRNALLLADRVYLGGAHRGALWSVFAERGMGYYASTLDSADGRPVESFALPPNGTPGVVSGIVTSDSGPIAGVPVRLPGTGGGFGADLAAVTGVDGRFRIGAVPPGTYPQLVAGPHAGFDRDVSSDVRVDSGVTTRRDLRLARNWAAASGGAEVVAVTHQFSGADCGAAGQVIDQSFGTGWNTHSPQYHRARGPKALTIRLPEVVDISSLAIDPTVPCGAGPSAGLGEYRIETSRDGQSFDVAAEGAFTLADGWRRNPVALRPGTGSLRRYVRLTGLSTMNSSLGYSGRVYMGVTEVSVYGRRASPAEILPPAVTPSPTATPEPTPPAADRIAPVISGLRARPATFRVTQPAGRRRAPRRATTFHYRLSENARVTARIECVGNGRGCRRHRRLPRLAADGRRGGNRLAFSGRLRAGGRTVALSPSRYRATFIAQDAAGNRSKPRTVGFRVARR